MLFYIPLVLTTMELVAVDANATQGSTVMHIQGK